MLGKMVWAPTATAPLCMSVTRFGIGAGTIASGRSPSIDMMMTRRAEGVKVSVGVAEGVGEAVGVAVIVGEAVAVKVGDGVAVGICVAVIVEVGTRKDRPGALGIWHASRRSNEKRRMVLRVR